MVIAVGGTGWVPLRTPALRGHHELNWAAACSGARPFLSTAAATGDLVGYAVAAMQLWRQSRLHAPLSPCLCAVGQPRLRGCRRV